MVFVNIQKRKQDSKARHKKIYNQRILKHILLQTKLGLISYIF
jgi:hypothetical protein